MTVEVPPEANSAPQLRSSLDASRTASLAIGRGVSWGPWRIITRKAMTRGEEVGGVDEGCLQAPEPVCFLQAAFIRQSQ